MSGELDFVTRLEYDSLKGDVKKVMHEFANIGNKAEAEGARIDRTFKRLGSAIVGYLGTQQLISFGKSIVDVRAEFEKFGIVLENTLGSKVEADNALNMVAEFAANTPFQLNELSDSFIRLTNQGFQPTREELVKLGDLASSTGKGFTQLSEAVIDAQTGEFERLKEFGIKASKSGEDVTFTFKEQQTTIKNTASEIRGYILSLGDLEGVAGANAKISASLSGQLSNLGDAWDNMLNKIGTDSQSVITDGIQAAKYLIDNYEEVAKILGVLIATYGAYKAAVIASIVAQKAAILAGNVKAWFQLARSIKSAKDAQILFNLAAKANPYVLLAAAIAGIVTALYLYSNRADNATIAQERLNSALDRANDELAKEQAKVSSLVTQIKDENISRDERNKKLKELISISPKHLNNLTLENIATKEGTAAINAYIEATKKKIQIQELENELSEAIKRQNAATGQKNDISIFEKAAYYLTGTGGGAYFSTKARIEKNIEEYEKEATTIEAITKKIAEIQAESFKEDGDGKDVSFVDPEKLKKTREKLQKLKEELSKSYREMGFEVTQAEVDGMREGLDKSLAQAQLNHELQLYEIEQQKQERLKKINEIEKLEGRKVSTELPETDKNYFQSLEKAAKATYNKAIEDAIKDDDKTLKAERDRLDKMVQEFETYQQKRIRVVEEYNKKIADLEAINTKGNYDENIKNAETEKQKALAEIDQEIASREVSFIVWSERIANLGLEKLRQALETANKLLEEGGLDENEKAVLRAEIASLTKRIKLEEERKKQGLTSDNAWQNTLAIMNEVNQTIGDVISNFEGLDDATKTALEAAINVSSSIIAMINGIQALSVQGVNALKGIEKASVILAIASAAISIISSITGFFKKNKEAEKAHQKALAEITRSKIAEQQEYNRLLREQNLIMEEAVSIFGEKQIARASNFIEVYRQAIEEYYETLQGDAPQQKKGIWKKFFEDEFKYQQEAYNQGVGALANAKVVTGSKTVSSGFLGLGKSQKDVYESILKVYPDLIIGENRLNIEKAKSILNTQKMSEADRQLLESLISLEEEAQKAQEALDNYLQETYGLLGNEIMNSLEEALRSGTDAWEDFGNAGAKVLEDLGKQIAYSLFFAKTFEDLQDQLTEIYSSGNEEQDIANSAAALIESFYNSIGSQMDDAQEFMQQWDDQLASFDLWSGDGREASQKGFASISQDSADELNGRFTAIQGHTYEINAGVKILSQNSARMLELLGGIETHTSRLERIEGDMHSVKVGIDNINTKGITIKS